MSARERMLERIATALGTDAEPGAVPREYRQAGIEPTGSPALVERFCERVADYRATVRVTAGERALVDAIAAACAERDSSTVAAAPGAGWRPEGVEVFADGPERDPRALDSIDAALTGCAVAVAETGTIALDGGPLCGRRALTLVPDHHICVVGAEQIVASVPDAVAALRDAAAARRPLTLVSGPSATSDIELQRVEGVHGPRQLDVIVAGP